MHIYGEYLDYKLLDKMDDIFVKIMRTASLYLLLLTSIPFFWHTLPINR